MEYSSSVSRLINNCHDFGSLMLALIAVLVLLHTTRILLLKNELDTKLQTKSAQNQITTGRS